jgi:hypothetical protein
MLKKGFKIYFERSLKIQKYFGPKWGFWTHNKYFFKDEKTLFFAFSTDIKALKKKSLL